MNRIPFCFTVFLSICSDSLVFFACRFFLFSALFFAIWIYIGRYYLISVAHISKLFLGFMGYDASLSVNHYIILNSSYGEFDVTGAELINYNIVPFLALVLSTPRINARRVLKAYVIGLPIFFLIHVINLVAHFPYYIHGSSAARVIISSAAVINLGLPLLLWIILCYVYIASFFKFRQSSPVSAALQKGKKRSTKR